MRERSLKSMALGLSGAAWLCVALCIALSGDPAVPSVRAHAGQTPQPAELRGDHRVSAMLGPRGAQLMLKDGLSLWARVGVREAPVQVTLAVSATRAQAAEIAPGFVPIGPSVRAAGTGVRAELAYRADAFRVRQGHRLVLALEARAPCAAGETCWQLLEAQYVGNRCRAGGVALRGLRLQFGSIPISASGPVRSGAR